MNIDVLVHWGQNMIAFLDTPQEVRKPTFDEELVEKKLGWSGTSITVERLGRTL